jgi:nitroreductase
MRRKMFDSLIETRRSIRKYLNKPVEPDKVEKLVEAALRAPSSMSRNPWEFIVVNNPETLEKLALSKEHGSLFLREAPLAIVVCANPHKCDVWIEDTSIASIFILLSAHDLGLGGCWIQIRERPHNKDMSSEAYVASILDIPPDLKVESIIALGYPDETKPGHPKEHLQFQSIHLNAYGEHYSQPKS